MAEDTTSSFVVNITIISGENLLACDKGDVSDPYVKMCQDKTVFFKTTHKSSTVNPVWNERFKVKIEDIKKPFLLQVFDKDKLFSDDFIGQAELDLSEYKLDESFDVSLHLEAANDKKLIKKTKKGEQSLGKITINIKLSHGRSYKGEDNVVHHRPNLHSSLAPEDSTEGQERLEVASGMMENQEGNKDRNRPGADNESFMNIDSKTLRTELIDEDEARDTTSSLQLSITIISGEDLLPCDKDVSDPYVKLCQDKTVFFKTNNKNSTVNPVWNEGFTVQIEDTKRPFLLQVFDKDKLNFDDFMGQADLDLTDCKLDESLDISLQLEAANDEKLIKKIKKSNQSLGNIKVNIKLSKIDNAKLEETKKEEQSFFKSLTKQFSKEKIKTSKQQIAIVHVVVVQAQSLALMQDATECSPYCKISLANQKYKSKIIKDSINPKWREAFNFFWYDDADDFLHIETCHNDDRVNKNDEFLGSVAVDLRDFSPEISHNMRRALLGEKGVHVGDIHIILTITCYTKNQSPSMLTNWNPEPEQEAQLSNQYNIRNTFRNVKDVGYLTIKVLGAEGLASSDYNLLADPFVVLELKNARVRTLAIRESLNPEWNQVFSFDVKDMNERLEVTVYDENDNKKEDFIGKVIIPLHKMVDGERRWFMLKDKQMWRQANGKNPRILLEMNIYWNPVRAAYRTIKEPEIKYMAKDDTQFEFQTLRYNYNRVQKKIHKIAKKVNYVTGRDFDVIMKKIESILDWESKVKSSFVCCAFVFVVWMFEIWMIPFALLIPFILRFMGVQKTEEMKKEVENIDNQKKETCLDDEHMTFSKMKEIGLIAQTKIEFLADFVESLGNIFNFSVPFISKLAFLAILLLTIVLYLVPFRVCFICWGLHKLTLRLFLPGHKLFNQSLLNFILAVPNDKMLEWCREIEENTEVKTVNPQTTK